MKLSEKLYGEELSRKDESVSEESVTKISKIKNFLKNSFKRKKKFVIDTSIASEEQVWRNLIKEANENDTQIILTSLTIRELHALQRYNDADGQGARHLLTAAAEDDKTFLTVKIDESLPVPDDCLIKYCLENKKKVILVTADKEMTLLVRGEVETRYISHKVKKKQNLERQKQEKHINSDIKTPKEFNPVLKKSEAPVAYVDGKMFIKYPSDANSLLKLISSKTELLIMGPQEIEVHVDDNIYMAVFQEGMIVFKHYKIISCAKENNAILVSSQEISPGNIRKIMNGDYRGFLKVFLMKYDNLPVT